MISYAFHPSLMPVLGIILAKMLLPYYFPQKLFYFTLLYVFLGTYIFPLVIALFLKKMGLLSSLLMQNAQERKYPFLVATLFYFLTANALREFSIPQEVYLFVLAGAMVTLCCYLLLGKLKVSAHMAGISGLTAFLIFLSLKYQYNLIYPITALILITGLVGSARLYLKAHNMTEVTTGALIGFSVTMSCLFFFANY